MPPVAQLAAQVATRPNVLFIMADDHAAHALSCYGSRINETPNLDRIARDGMRFTNCFVTNAICGPSRAVILTGRYSHLNGFARNEGSFDGSQITFPKLLHDAGYATAMIGKWHLGSDPTGFDHWIVLPGQGRYVDPEFIDKGERRRIEGHCTDITTDLALDWLQHGRPADRPFLLMCHHKAPHRNWIPAERHREQWAGRAVPVPDTFDDDWSFRASPARSTSMTVAHHLTRNDVKGVPPAGLGPAERARWFQQRYMEDYLACVQGVDEGVGRLLDWLDSSGLAANTIVVYTSDQGFFLGDHGWYDKRFMYEESLRVPLLVRWPGTVAPGSVCDALALNLDFAQTLLDACGVDAPTAADAVMQGSTLVPVLRAAGRAPDDWRRSVYYRYYEYPGVHDVRRHFGVRTDRYKLICYHDLGEWELFDLREDPHELASVHGDPRYAAVERALQAELAAVQRRYGDEGEVRDPRLAHFAEVPAELIADWRAERVVPAAPGWIDVGARKLDLPLAQPRWVGTADGLALRIGGVEGIAVLSRTAAVDVSFAPFAVTAVLRRDGPAGVVAALGGGSHGFALWCADGRPCFGVRSDGELRIVRGPAALPADRFVSVEGALDGHRRLVLRVDGVEVATAQGIVLRALPAEPLSVGADTGSLVGDYTDGAGLAALLRGVRLVRGVTAR
ncbi:MAG: sulfatase [Planctomycetes bacterium]|nr:sulfatase [Planctomycetota bacterium]